MSVPFFGAESRLTLDTVTATTADSGYPATNLYDDRTYVLYSATAASTVDIITDAGSGQSVSVDYCGIVNHNFYTKGATVTFAHSTNGSAYTTIFTVTPSDNTIILRWFTRVSDR